MAVVAARLRGGVIGTRAGGGAAGVGTAAAFAGAAGRMYSARPLSSHLGH